VNRLFGRGLGRLGLDEDAFAGTLLGGFYDEIELAIGHVGEAVGTLRVALGFGEDLVAFANIRKAVVEQDEYIGCDLLTEAVSRA
jgi:hypothetical protein